MTTMKFTSFVTKPDYAKLPPVVPKWEEWRGEGKGIILFLQKSLFASNPFVFFSVINNLALNKDMTSYTFVKLKNHAVPYCMKFSHEYVHA